MQFLYIDLYVCSGCDGFTGICSDPSLPFVSFASENSVFENRAGMPTGTNGKLRAAAIRATGILVSKLNIAFYCCFVIPLTLCRGFFDRESLSLDSGYRYYGTEQFEVSNTIRYLRVLDMPLSEIEDFLKNKDIDRIEEKLRQPKQTVLGKQQALKRIEQKIEHRLNWLTDAENIPLNMAA